MGNASVVPSTKIDSARTVTTVTANVEQIIDYVMPIYYTKLPLLPHCKEKLIEGWKKISANKAEGFYKLKAENPEQVPCPTPMVFFANRIVLRLCEVHPVCNSMFKKSSLKHGTLILNMFTALIKEIDNPEAFNNISNWVFEQLNLESLEKFSWIKFYSRVLDVVVPIVLAHEISQSHVAKEFNVKRMMPIMATSEMAQRGLIEETTTKTVSSQ
eukprot:gene13660-15845_t